eukprot:TRINITY_DN12579_c0_g2_i3.p1 TRINITY_DN12579_c0_g2~~TRINITY_DN12579_c0_g2_i3.p1  ORF type:complete len:127 (+),score=20.89 TRINITY_DN12579_c0_g2_i3:371-751(+)
MKAEELLLNCVMYFNKVLREENYGIQLKDNDQLYKLYIAKKNGKVKDDFPPIEKNQTIMELNFTRLAMSCPPESLIAVEVRPLSNPVPPALSQPVEKREQKAVIGRGEERRCCYLLCYITPANFNH